MSADVLYSPPSQSNWEISTPLGTSLSAPIKKETKSTPSVDTSCLMANQKPSLQSSIYDEILPLSQAESADDHLPPRTSPILRRVSALYRPQYRRRAIYIPVPSQGQSPWSSGRNVSVGKASLPSRNAGTQPVVQAIQQQQPLPEEVLEELALRYTSWNLSRMRDSMPSGSQPPATPVHLPCPPAVLDDPLVREQNVSNVSFFRLRSAGDLCTSALSFATQISTPDLEAAVRRVNGIVAVGASAVSGCVVAAEARRNGLVHGTFVLNYSTIVFFTLSTALMYWEVVTPLLIQVHMVKLDDSPRDPQPQSQAAEGSTHVGIYENDSESMIVQSGQTREVGVGADGAPNAVAPEPPYERSGQGVFSSSLNVRGRTSSKPSRRVNIAYRVRLLPFIPRYCIIRFDRLQLSALFDR
ncbi:unnamed protein product [Dibothriocephalus latus]|uniref:Uncharacterized protein n=1 Tax=Dibothriocephalus latus TaxID=60516 RepID=A0A3P7NUF3_DIBLA|nr:unnamed protein product [Dibothriocephalus latus]